MVVLCSKHKEITMSRRYGAQSPEIPFLVLTQVVISPVCLALTGVCLVNDTGENILCIIHPNGQKGAFINADIGLVVLGELRSQ